MPSPNKFGKKRGLMMLFVKHFSSYPKLSEDLRKKRPPRQDLGWDVYLRVQQRRNEPTAGTAAAPGSGHGCHCPSSAPLSCVLLQQPQSRAGDVQSWFLAQPPSTATSSKRSNFSFSPSPLSPATLAPQGSLQSQ